MVPETEAVNEAVIGYGSAPTEVVPPPVTATPLSHPTVGYVLPLKVLILFGFAVSDALTPARKVAR